MIKKLTGKIKKLPKKQKRLFGFASIFAVVGLALLVSSYAAPTFNKKIFFPNSPGIEHDYGQLGPPINGEFFGQSSDVWASHGKSTGYLWRGPGETIKTGSEPQELAVCYAVRDVGNLYFEVPANITFDIAAGNGQTVLKKARFTLEDDYKNQYWYGFKPFCLSVELKAKTTYEGLTYRIKVNKGGVWVGYVSRTTRNVGEGPDFNVVGLEDGQVVSGDFSVEATHEGVPDFTNYTFVLNGHSFNVEQNAPWCFNGDNGTCNKFDSTKLKDGDYSMLIAMSYGDGDQIIKTITFTVDNSSKPPPDDPPPSSSMGPNGEHWPSNTPDYNTPATTTISNLSQLNSALASANSGDVIEVAPHTYSSVLKITSGKSSWAKNVLVRPRLGQRQSVVMNAEIAIESPNVTVAGFKLNSIFRGNRGANRSNFARLEMAAQSAGFLTDVSNFGLYEIVAPDYGVGGDRLQIRSTSPSYPANNNVVAGSWLKGKWRYVGGTDHNDTIQTYGTSGGTVNNLLLIDNVFWASGDKAFQTGNTYDLVIRNNYFQEPGSSTAPQPPSGQEKYGYHAITGGGYDAEAYNNIVAGSVSSTVPYVKLYDNKAQSWSQAVDSRNNVFEPNYNPSVPGLANLNQIWN